jgi:predicted nucleotidyltransferase
MSIVEQNTEAIHKLCLSYHVDKMYLFGSALNKQINKESDIDFLVKFKQIDLYHYFNNYMCLKEALKTLLGHEIDLVEEQTLKNPILIESINRSKKLIYG